MDRLFIIFQHLVPQQLVSRVAGVLAELQQPRWFKNWLIGQFIHAFKVDMSEAAEPNPARYACFNEFFTRPLREGARPIAQADIVCPADGAISQMGVIDNGLLLQAKGRHFTATDLIGGDAARAVPFLRGRFATIYLSPKDYHRVHMPLAGRLVSTTYVPGRLFSVNGVTAGRVDRLFARNERLVCHFETACGPMALILVGAMVVAGIETVWSGRVKHARQPITVHHAPGPSALVLSQGAELGRFFLGSTVILLFPEGAVEWEERYTAGTNTRMGEQLGSFRLV